MSETEEDEDKFLLVALPNVAILFLTHIVLNSITNHIYYLNTEARGLRNLKPLEHVVVPSLHLGHHISQLLGFQFYL